MTILSYLKSLVPKTPYSNCQKWSPGADLPYLHVKSGKIYHVISERAISADNELDTDAETRIVVYTDGENIYTRPYRQFHEIVPETGQRRFKLMDYATL